jgi:phosphoglycerate kinase
MNWKTLNDINFRGKTVIVRVDFNVPIEDGKAKNDRKIRESVPTIAYLHGAGAKVILMSHLGRPKGAFDPKYSLEPVSHVLSKAIKRKVKFVHECVGPDVRSAVISLKPGEILLLENTRFHPEEERNDNSFARELASLADVYVNDAFGTAHRAHASTHGIARYLPGCVGFLMEREIESLSTILYSPGDRFTVVLGGAKVSDKIQILTHLVKKDLSTLIVGGGMAFTFILAKGGSIGNSLVEKDRILDVKEILATCKQRGVDILLPVDVVATQRLEDGAKTMICDASRIPDGWMGADIGPRTIEQFTSKIKAAKTIFWNGPMGAFEKKGFGTGTEAIAKAIAGARAFTVAGGGDTLRAIEELNLENEFSHVSTGGGASLEFLEGIELPGLSVLRVPDEPLTKVPIPSMPP